MRSTDHVCRTIRPAQRNLQIYMRNAITKISLWLLLAGLLATPAFIKRFFGGTARATSPSEALLRYGFQLQDVTASTGIDFIHQAPHLDSRLDHIMPQIASMGAAVSVVAMWV